MTVINLLYPWSRMLTNSFVLLGCYFYLRAILEERFRLLSLAFLLLTAAHLTHYSADPVILVVGIHWVATFLRRFASIWKPALAAMAVSLALNACWYGWAVVQFGWLENVSSNTTWQNIQIHSFKELAGQMVGNLLTTLIPFGWTLDIPYIPQNKFLFTLPTLYDSFHLYWAANLVGAVSESVLILFVVSFLTRRLSLNKVWPRPERNEREQQGKQAELFVIGLSAGVFLVSFPITPNFEAGGIVHLALQPISILLFLLLLGLVSKQGKGYTRTFALLYGAAAFFFYFLKTLRIEKEVAAGVSYSNPHYYDNLVLKQQHNLVFLSDQCGWLWEVSRPVILVLVPLLVFFAWRLLHSYWYGSRSTVDGP